LVGTAREKHELTRILELRLLVESQPETVSSKPNRNEKARSPLLAEKSFLKPLKNAGPQTGKLDGPLYNPSKRAVSCETTESSETQPL